MAATPRQLFLILSLAACAVLRPADSARHHPRASAASYRCGWCPRRSTASLLPPPDAAALAGAACGFGASETAAMAMELAGEGFHIAAVSGGLFRDGRACGACYQLRCRGRTACAQDGVKVVVVSDVADTNRTGGGRGRFLLTGDAFAAMAGHGAMSARHDGGGDGLATLDVDFRRIPCHYKRKNLSVKVEETSARDTGRLALRFLYQGGQTDIAAVEVAQAVIDHDAAPSLTTWRYMTRREESPAVWSTPRAPAGPLRLRIVVTAGSGGRWLRADGAVLPADWVPGGVYDTGLRVADVAASTCGGASCASADEGGDEEQR